MRLSPIPPAALDAVLARYAAALPRSGPAERVFRRIAASRHFAGVDPARRHRDAVALARRLGMAPLAEAPHASYSWEGGRVRTLSDPAVLIHEVAHFQLASPARRFLPDFGLGAGPETGLAAAANAWRRLGDGPREAEEQMASLLGVLWEVALGHPGIEAFEEQNWLEGAGRPGAGAFLAETLDRLEAAGVIGVDGRPLATLRITPDP